MKMLVSVLMFMPALALAAGVTITPVPDAPPFGLSNNVVGHRAGNVDHTAIETRQLLDEQAHSAPATKSEISAPVYVQTQQRLSKSFDEPIPDFKDGQTLNGSGN